MSFSLSVLSDPLSPAVLAPRNDYAVSDEVRRNILSAKFTRISGAFIRRLYGVTHPALENRYSFASTTESLVGYSNQWKTRSPGNVEATCGRDWGRPKAIMRSECSKEKWRHSVSNNKHLSKDRSIFRHYAAFRRSCYCVDLALWNGIQPDKDLQDNRCRLFSKVNFCRRHHNP